MWMGGQRTRASATGRSRVLASRWGSSDLGCQRRLEEENGVARALEDLVIDLEVMSGGDNFPGRLLEFNSS
jgi:hypothetical protein